MMDLTGRKFGKYELVESLGQGGMAEVYKAHQPGLDRFVAIKVMHRHLASSPDFVSRFQREAKSIGQLQHAHIMHVIDFDVENDIYYLVMDYIQGDTLRDYLALKGALPVDEALAIVAQLVDAVDYAHRQGMIHRDIKPANVMFRDDTHSQVILTDFGMARLQDDSSLTLSGTLIGTPAYMSPEAINGAQVDERTDIYSLGIVLYEMVTGRTPYTGDTPVSIIFKQAHEPLPPPREFRPDLPELVEQILLKALAKDREDRFQDAAEFKAALLQVQQSLAGDKDVNLAPTGKSSQRDVRPYASPEVEKETPKAKPGRLLALVAGGLLLVIVLAGLFLSSRGPTAQENPGPAVESEVTTPLVEASRPEPVVADGVSPVGTLRFADNETVRAGSFSLHMDGVDTPPPGSHYELWLSDSNREKTLNLVSQLVVNNGRVNFEGSTEQNLLGNYSQVIVSLEPDDDSEAGMSDQVVFAGSLPGESLAHLRQVTFKDPVNGKGFLPGAEEQILIAINHTGFVQEALASDDLSQARRHAEHVVNILEGKEGPHFGDLDGDGLAQNPGDGFGVRPYLARALEQIQLASETTTATADTQLYADRILTTGNNTLALVDAAAEKALQIFAADTVAEAQSFADELEMLVDQVLNGADLDNNGAIDPTKNEGGLETLYQDSLRMGEMPIFATE